MTRLELCQKLNRIIRIDAIGSPSATTSQTGTSLEIVKFIDDAYATIQAEADEWSFMVLRSTFALSAGTHTYSRATIQGALSTYDKWLALNGQEQAPYVLVYLTASGVADQSPCYYVPYEQWRGQYDRGTRPTGKPLRFTEQPDRSLEFHPTPDAAYTVSLDYKRTPHVLSSDAEASTGTPIIPSDHHDAIVWQAAMNYADTREVSDASLAKWDRNRRREMNRLRVRCLPEPELRQDRFYTPK